jgi:syntaxin 8
MTNPSQLFLLADHIKLSLLERQRAISLDLEPNAQDGEISRSLESLQAGIQAVEAEQARLAESNDSAGAAALKDQLGPLHDQYQDLSSQFYGADGVPSSQDPTQASDSVHRSTTSPDLKQPVPQHPPSKSVRFMDNSAAAAAVQEEIDEEEDRSRQNLFRPYRDEPSPPGIDQSNMSNDQIYQHHDRVMREQDDQLDQLGESIGRQHQLSIQIGDELDGHVALLDGMDGDVERHQSRLDGARRRLDRFRRKAGDNWSMMTIIGLIIILVILIVILK